MTELYHIKRKAYRVDIEPYYETPADYYNNNPHRFYKLAKVYQVGKDGAEEYKGRYITNDIGGTLAEFLAS